MIEASVHKWSHIRFSSNQNHVIDPGLLPIWATQQNPSSSWLTMCLCQAPVLHPSSLCSGRAILYIFRVGPLGNMNSDLDKGGRASDARQGQGGACFLFLREPDDSELLSSATCWCDRGSSRGRAREAQTFIPATKANSYDNRSPSVRDVSETPPPPSPSPAHSQGAQRNILPTRNAVK